MSINLYALSFDAKDPAALARFWGGVLRREVAEDDGVYLTEGNAGFRVRFLPSDAIKDRPNQMHFDLTSQTPEDQQATVARALELGGRHLDIGQGPEITHVVLADPEGNEFCVIAAGNNFLANTATIGALSSDGTQAVGYFWSKALDWPLVWDQDEETAIQSPQGGSKISWGGPPVEPKAPKNRLHLDVAPPPGGNAEAEVERLLTLGARRLTTGQHGPDAIPLADPDGNEFCILTPR
ncbi:VOC family protein [Kribbella solani]|uniref:VOC family protein n=1 Tax=Kribbella solani TaxID=236067 RepID=UPI0029ABBE38|nr:VOC family protein [Kribbella solani]MDX2972420.1 VOC family protein [Kribbella solani]MDX3006997.1 VOC family protein [Kribbella solani]